MLKENRFYVYVYYDDFGVPVYVGKGSKYRWKCHIRDAKRDKKQTHFIKWLRKYIIDNDKIPNVEYLAEEISNDDAIILEKYYINKFGRYDKKIGTLYNHTDGGEGALGRIVSENERQHKRNIASTIWTDDRRNRVRNTLIGRKHSDCAIIKMKESAKRNAKLRVTCNFSKYLYIINGVRVVDFREFCAIKQYSYSYLVHVLMRKNEIVYRGDTITRIKLLVKD